jgi:ubiquinone biosynthesis protein COQ4
MAPSGRHGSWLASSRASRKPLQLWPPFPIPPLFPIWLHKRVRHSHDVWHVICGCPTTVAGEVAMNGVNVTQLRWPGSAMLLGADLLHRCLEGPVAGEVDYGQAAAYGLELGRISAPLLAQRWEEGWDRPLAAWREQLGITALVARSPFRASTPATV